MAVGVGLGDTGMVHRRVGDCGDVLAAEYECGAVFVAVCGGRGGGVGGVVGWCR